MYPFVDETFTTTRDSDAFKLMVYNNHRYTGGVDQRTIVTHANASWSGSVLLQIRREGMTDSDWVTLDTFTGDAAKTIIITSNVFDYRLSVTRTAGTMRVVIA